MSNRTMLEINHDYAPRYGDELEEWAKRLRMYLSSGDPKDLPDGVTFFGSRHHSQKCRLGEPPYGWDNKQAGKTDSEAVKPFQVGDMIVVTAPTSDEMKKGLWVSKMNQFIGLYARITAVYGNYLKLEFVDSRSQKINVKDAGLRGHYFPHTCCEKAELAELKTSLQTTTPAKMER